MSILGKIGSKGANEIIDFAERLMAKEAPKKAAERREAIKSSAEAEDIIINKINSDPNAMDDMPMSILENLSVKNKAKIGLADEYSSEIAESTGGMLKEMSPKEAAENLLAFEDDEIFDYMSTLNARDLRIFKDNLSDDDFEAFGGYMPDLGPREAKAEGGEAEKKPSGMFQALSLLGVPQSTIDKMTETVGDIPKSVADSIIYLGDKARDAGLIDKPERKGKAEGALLGPMEGKEKEAEKAIIINKLTDIQDPNSKSRNNSLVYLKKADPSLVMSAIGQTVSPEDQRQIRTQIYGREEREEGGSMLVPPEMPVDTYTPEEQANAKKEQLPDGEMEEEYMGFIFDESLQSEEKKYLMSALESDPKLSDIFDKVLMTASEFSGSGKVEGPGTGVSDSIPARLSDGEFVITEKATSMLGADNLQKMMDNAERMADGGRATRQAGGLLESNIKLEEEEQQPMYNGVGKAIQKSMLYANQSPSLRGSRVI